MRRLTGLACVMSCLAMAACTPGSTTSQPSPTDSADQAAELVSMSPPSLERCLGHRQLQPACPRRVPVGVGKDAEVFSVGRYWTFSMSGGTSYANPARDRPPDFVHIVVQGDDLAEAFQTFEYRQTVNFLVRDGLMLSEERLRLARLGRSGRTPLGIFLGGRNWNGRTGDLVLAPPFEHSGTIHADHLLFRWAEGNGEYLISLHAWEPFPEAVSTLRAMVDSLPAG